GARARVPCEVWRAVRPVAAGSARRVGSLAAQRDADAGAGEELLEPPLDVGAEQGGRPGGGGSDTVDGAQGQPLPALAQPAVERPQLDVVDDLVAVAAPLAGGEEEGHVGGEAVALHPLDRR